MSAIITPEEKDLTMVRRLIWLYFWLLILEGALRKWVVPGLSNPLLVIRDPVALAIYYYALKAHIFPRNGWIISLVLMGVLSTAASLIRLAPWLPFKVTAFITIYGVHADFFHLPLIFVIGAAFRYEDVKTFGWWTLALLVPMSLLMVAQFRASPDSFLNRTAGGEGEMMLSALGKVRTAGPFTFVIGVVAYFALATAFLLWAVLKRGLYKNWLLAAGACSLIVGVAVSGSRSVVGAVAIVLACLLIVFFMRRDAVNRVGQALIVALILGFIASRFTVFREGVDVLSTRFTEVAEASEQSMAVGLIGRVFAPFTEAIDIMPKAPLFGYGLGIGTNAGANILTGHSMFLLTEGEPSRIILESGPLLGLAYIFWRVAFTLWLGWICLKAVGRGVLLPLFIFSSCFISLVDGQFGQPTILGFAVFASGMALAAMKEVDEIDATPGAFAQPPVRRVGRRSVYAERMHGSSAGPGRSNGFVDR